MVAMVGINDDDRSTSSIADRLERLLKPLELFLYRFDDWYEAGAGHECGRLPDCDELELLTAKIRPVHCALRPCHRCIERCCDGLGEPTMIRAPHRHRQCRGMKRGRKLADQISERCKAARALE